MSTGPKKDNRGGARAGAGRKPETLSARQVQAMLDKAKLKAKEAGKGIDDILLELIYGEHAPKDTLAAIKLWKEYTIAKLSEGGETDTVLGPAVYLPEQRPKLTVVK